MATFLYAAPARADCTTVTMGNQPEGAMFYNDDENVLQYCDGTNWVAMHAPGTGTGGCATATMGAQAEGKTIYNADNRIMQNCAGNEWMPMGPVGGKGQWVQVQNGEGHTCAIKTDGTLWCWGRDGDGQLGEGAGSADQPSPVQESTAATDWAQVTAGVFSNHTCAIKTNGTLWCWGNDGDGQLGEGGGSADQPDPVQESTAAAEWAQVAAAGSHSCAIKTDGSLWCWGTDADGQLGNGATAGDQHSRTQESTSATDWAQVSTGNDHTCAVKTGGTLWCWGDDTDGQLGNGGTTGDQISPVQESTSATDWVKVATGDRHTCAIKANGTLWCWGGDAYGKLGNGSAGSQTSPDQESTSATDWASLDAGRNYVCAIKTGGTLWCWGFNGLGHLGNGTTSNQGNPVQEATTSTDWAQISAASGHTCAIKTNGTLWCWGTDENERLGNGDATVYLLNSPSMQVAGGKDWEQLDSAANSNCALRSDNTLWCWGEGIGNTPVQESTSTTTWETFEVNGGNVCAVRTNGTLWCWGSDDYGELCNGAAGGQANPYQVGTDTDWMRASPGSEHTCAIKTDGTLWCCGRDNVGQLGNGAGVTSNQQNPYQESTAATDWASVSVSYSGYTCAIKTGGTLWCWGSDTDGRLGNGADGDQSDPDQELTAATNWAQVSTGYLHACAVRTNGTLWCWGSDDYGQIGNGATMGDQVSPVQETTAATDWVQVAAKSYHTCAVKTDGTLWCWGLDEFGQLGNGTGGGTTRNSPDQEDTAATNWTAVAIGGSHSCALKTNGSIWCWGMNNLDQLGLGTVVPNTPIHNALCVNPERSEGALIYNSTNNVMQYCDGVSWVRIGK